MLRPLCSWNTHDTSGKTNIKVKETLAHPEWRYFLQVSAQRLRRLTHNAAFKCWQPSTVIIDCPRFMCTNEHERFRILSSGRHKHSSLDFIEQ